ncbi:MAG: DUF6382 domain-containing protein [Oscillospiraceae bacterium]|nr:DUF6382 domain-containing protein [Oscillospiraceae bacterium]
MKCYNETKDAVYYLVYEFDGEDKIDQTAAGMIANNKISGIMPFTITQMDSCVKVRYDITAMISVSQWLSEYTCKERVINVIDTVLSVFEQSENYLLDRDSVILDCEKIFYNVKTNKIWLVILPVLGKNIGNPTLDVFLKSFVCGLNADHNENCDYIGKMLAYLNARSDFVLADFRFIIDEQKTRLLPEHLETLAENEDVQDDTVEETDSEEQIKYTLCKHDIDEPPAVAQQKQSAEDEKMTDFKMPLNLYADSEKENQDNRNKKSLFAKIFSQSKSKNKTNNKISTVSFDAQDDNESINLQYFDSSGNVSKQNTVAPEKILENETLKVTGSFLLRVRNNEKIPINKNSFRLGSDKRAVDYCIADNHAVSRSHAQIILKNGAYFLVDNDSTNHTYLNDHLIKSEHEMKLLDRSRIRLANEEFIFYG